MAQTISPSTELDRVRGIESRYGFSFKVFDINVAEGSGGRFSHA